MKYRVLRFFKGEPYSNVFLIGHYDTKMQARNAASDDLYNHSHSDQFHELSYNIESVDREMTQDEITKIFNEMKARINADKT